jgi:putative SOS response-associated peptidase YedK
MCTRYFVKNLTPELREIIEEVEVSPLSRRFMLSGSKVKTEGEIRPTDVVPVLAPDMDGTKKVYPMKWGYSNPYHGGKLILNARSETAGTKLMFKEDWFRHRCIIPASYYFEWEHIRSNDGKIITGDRYIIEPKGETVTWLCGLYHIENNFPTFVILTREPGKEIEFIHDRMPLILPTHLVPEWIRPDSEPEELMKEALTDMIAEKG